MGFPLGLSADPRILRRRLDQRPNQRPNQRPASFSRIQGPIMTLTKFHVAGIGNAIVDITARTEPWFLESHELSKGAMTLIDAGRAAGLYAELGPAVESSGGSAANTIAGLAGLGARTAYIGKVKDDVLGGVFRHDVKSLGVYFETPGSTGKAPTASCLVLVTPDADRTMLTHLGACVELGPDDVEEAVIAESAVTYLEGYLFDPPAAKEAFRKAASIARGAGNEVALSLSDPFCVERHRHAFLELVSEDVDILFANEDEIVSLYQASSFDEAMRAVRGHCEVAVLTRGRKGSVVVSGQEVHVVEAEPVTQVVDTTGAGDAYAAGFLHGRTHGRDLAAAARMGGVMAAEVISHLGARAAADPQVLMAGKIKG